MAVLDDEIARDMADDARERAFMQRHLPDELRNALSEQDLQTVIEAACDYYATSGILENTGNKDVDVDADKVAGYVRKQFEAENRPAPARDVLLQLVLLDMDYNWA